MDLKNRKVLLIVPHQDDEINIAGNIMDIFDKENLYIIYSSLDIDFEKGLTRKREALASCAVWNIKADHIFFLEYPDIPVGRRTHYYTSGDTSIEIVIEKIINEMQPNVIIATDFDFHPDHRMLSLAFERAMGRLLKKNSVYNPVVLKGFCYETAYYGLEDYTPTGPGLCKIKSRDLSNASFVWGSRLSIKTNEVERIIWRRKAFKALLKHKSQYAVLHAKSIINNDNVYWIRRTDNLLNTAVLTASSGNVEKIRDFQIIDTDDIETKDPKKISYAKANWIPEEENIAWIKAQWEKPVNFDRIVFHGDPNASKGSTVNIKIYADDTLIGEIDKIEAWGRDTTLVFPEITCEWLYMCIETTGTRICLSEIEVLLGQNIKVENIKSNGLRNCNSNPFLDVFSECGYKLITLYLRMVRKICKQIHC